MKNIPGVFKSRTLFYLNASQRQHRALAKFLVSYGKDRFRDVCRSVAIPDETTIGRFSRSEASRVIAVFKMMESEL